MIEWQRSGPEPGKDYSDILYEAAEGIAKITINRPEVRNAFRPTTLFELSNAFNVARDDPGIGVIILTGAGDKAFCSGGDQKIRGDDGYVGPDGVGRLNVLDLQVQISRAGMQQFAGDATLLYYMSEVAQEGRDAFKEKRVPDFAKFPRRP